MDTPQTDTAVTAVAAVATATATASVPVPSLHGNDALVRHTDPSEVAIPQNGYLTVVIRRCGDVPQDVARLEAVHQVLVEFKGQQHFSICLRNAGKRDLTLDFPNDSTRDCAELRQKLTALGAQLAR
jgi:hypothetical protein